ncbi:response regulator (plasmid) [Halobaculum sp. CBA1158]|uniref:response regulator n=1 Tax=Halobaculum sp. CBA1158 TaxID=2904243 RepID=UPI001F3077EE|nr:response regulator [Halobaculum sp. CBA1158]UIP01357.1 response regulator [Halobaculum sp. CBA1158]
MTDEHETVLLVDDESALVDLYANYLGGAYRVLTATSGEEALEVVSDAVDVVLLDRRMPDMRGEEVLREIRSNGIEPQVAMLTAVEPTVDIVDMPFDDYRVKPVDKPELLGLIETLLERAAYDEHSQEFFALASKKAALEVGDADDTDEYEELCVELEEVRERIDATLDRIDTRGAFADLAKLS